MEQLQASLPLTVTVTDCRGSCRKVIFLVVSVHHNSVPKKGQGVSLTIANNALGPKCTI